MRKDTDVWDVIVIGGGNAALCAAISAREAGAQKVLMLEAAPRQWRGGNSQHTRSAFRVGWVALSTAAATGAVRAVDLEDLDAALLKEAAQPGAVGASAFHAGAAQHAKALRPTQELLITSRIGCDRKGSQQMADCINHSANMHVQMGVDPENDFARLAGMVQVFHVLSLGRKDLAMPNSAEGQDTHGAGQGSYQVTRGRLGFTEVSTAIGRQVNTKA